MNAVDEAECKLLSDLVQEHFGLSFSGVRRDILASRVRPRLTALRLGTLLDYYHYLRSHPQRDGELDQLARHLTNNETYFYREMPQLQVFFLAMPVSILSGFVLLMLVIGVMMTKFLDFFAEQMSLFG